MLTFCAIHLAQPEGIEAMPRRKTDPLEIGTVIVLAIVIALVVALIVNQTAVAVMRWAS